MRSWTGRAVVAVLAASALVACSDDDAEDGTRDEPVLGIGSALEASTTGVCLQLDEDIGPEVAELPTIPCEEQHTHEVFAAVEVTGQELYPGMTELEAFAERECYTEFEPYVGISPFDSELFVTWMVPSLDGWNDQGDREVLCLLGRRDAGQLTGSARGQRL